MSDLILHAGAVPVERDGLEMAIMPEPTETFSPISHLTMVDSIERSCNKFGVQIDSTQFALSRRAKNIEEPVIGERMFGLFNLHAEDNGHGHMIGIRNSYNKSMSVGITAGIRVFICDNLAFSGEYIALRRHTKGLDDRELDRIVDRAIMKTIKRGKEMSMWQRALKTISVTEEEAMFIFVEGLEQKVFSGSKFKSLLKCWRSEKNISGHTMYAVHGAFTRLYREDNLFRIAKFTAVANEVIDEQVILRQQH